MGRRWAVASCALAVTLTALALFALTATTGACQDHSCDFGGINSYRVDPLDASSPALGHLVTPDYWESTPVDADWMDFPPNYGWSLNVPEWATEQRPFTEVHAYISEKPHPVCHGDGCDPKQNFTEGTGNVAEFSRASPGFIWIINSTCAHFYLRVVLRSAPDGG
jgi:hypothetical protein